MNKFWTLCLLFILGTVFYFFVFLQWYLVSSTWLFVLIVIFFVFMSFASSAFETAFSTASTDSRIQQAIATEAKIIAQRFNKFDRIVLEGRSIEQFDAAEKRELAQTQRAKRRLERKEGSLGEEERSLYVGTFASLSVFLNIALAASLPYAMATNVETIAPIKFSFISWIEGSQDGLKFVWKELDLSGNKTLVFFASAFPILIFGKILPKEVGIVFCHFFAYKLNAVARALVWLFGVIPLGMRWPIGLLRKYRD